MRIVTPLLLVLLLAPAVLAQPCDPAETDEACADTTDWRRYFPLEVGNLWQYREDFYDKPLAHWSWTITGETEVDGQAYFELERCDDAGDGSATCNEPILLRYDDEHELIVRRTESGEAWWDVLPCGLGAAFNTGEAFDEDHECSGPAEGFVLVSSQGAYGATVAVPPDEVTGDTRKDFEMYPGTGPEMYAGLGVTKYHYDLEEIPTGLVYANVGGEQVGTPAFASCDPADADPDVACPDTTDWRRYFPLEVGNQWQYYRSYFGEGGGTYYGIEVVGTEEIEEEVHYVMRQCESASGDTSCGQPFPVRYDEEGRSVVRRMGNGEYSLYPDVCDLGLPFSSYTEVPCEIEGGTQGWAVLGQYGYIFDLDAGPSIVGTSKSYDGLGGGVEYVADVGPVQYWYEASEDMEFLVFARIDGVEYGTPAFVFPTSGEPEGVQPVATAFTEAFPNPARGTMRAQYALAAPQTVTLELIDLLGRRVRMAEEGPQSAGTHNARLDLDGLRAGLYVLRLRGDAGAEATRRIVVVQ